MELENVDEQARVRAVDMVPYARNGLGKGKLLAGKVLGSSTCGILAQGRWPWWAGIVESCGLKLEWILGVTDELLPTLGAVFPGVTMSGKNIVDEMVVLKPVSILLCEKRGPPTNSVVWNCPSLVGVVTPNGHALGPSKAGWQDHRARIRHQDLGGVTDGAWFVTVATRQPSNDQLFTFDGLPAGNLISCLDQSIPGVACSAPDGQEYIGVHQLNDMLYSSRDGLYPFNGAKGRKFAVPSFRSKTGWCERFLTPNELSLVWDLSDDFQKRFGVPKTFEKDSSLGVPLKIRRAVLKNICEQLLLPLGTVKRKRLVCLDADEDVIRPKKMLKRLSTVPEEELSQGDLANGKDLGDHNLKAARADDAEVPRWIWNDRILLGIQPLGHSRERVETALEIIRERFVHKIWVRNLARSFWQWRLKRSTIAMENSSVEGGLDAIHRALDSTWWEWDRGSRLHFWRWPKEYQEAARDGVRPYFKTQAPRWTRPQRVPSDPKKFLLMQEKAKKVRDRGYVAPGQVLSLMNVFDVPKGEEDIRLVYDGTKSGLNDSLWAPWFPLPTIEGLLRCVVGHTWLGDNDVGEQFHNFTLHLTLQPYCGFDLTRLFPSELKSGQSVLWERWTRAPMGVMQSPHQAAQGMIWWDEMMRGDRHSERNIFRWSKIILNLPGKESYRPSMPWVYKVRQDGEVAADLKAYVDDLRGTGATEDDCWQVTRRAGSMASYAGIQDASRKRREVSQTPGAWAGSILRTQDGEVRVTISQERWDKTKKILSWIWEALQSDPNRIPFKTLESYRGFLVYVTRTYPASVPYLKGIHLTLDSWRTGRDDDGWRMARKATDYLTELSAVEEPDAPAEVKAVPRLADDVQALRELFAGDEPVLRPARPSSCAVAVYGFGDASGAGFGSTCLREGVVHYRLGHWNDEIAEGSSNFRELFNLIQTVEDHVKEGLLHNSELFLFTDNTTAESAFYKGTSKSRALFDLVLRLRVLQMKHSLHLHVIHVAGTRMIDQGTDGLSRADLNNGVLSGMDMMKYVPLHLTAIERSSSLVGWVHEWYPSSSLRLLQPEDWFDNALTKRIEHCLWAPAPAAADVAVEQLCYARLKRPDTTHLIIIPRLLTSRWRKQLSKTADVVFTVRAIESFWDATQHEPLIVALCFPFIRTSPWRLRGTPFVERVAGRVREVQENCPGGLGIVLHELLVQAWAMDTLPRVLVRSLLQR